MCEQPRSQHQHRVKYSGRDAATGATAVYFQPIHVLRPNALSENLQDMARLASWQRSALQQKTFSRAEIAESPDNIGVGVRFDHRKYLAIPDSLDLTTTSQYLASSMQLRPILVGLFDFKHTIHPRFTPRKHRVRSLSWRRNDFINSLCVAT